MSDTSTRVLKTRHSLGRPSLQIVFCTSTDPTGNYIAPENVGVPAHDHHHQLQWIEYFAILEPLQSQCISSGKKLVTVMGDIRNADIQVSYWSTAAHCAGSSAPLQILLLCLWCSLMHNRLASTYIHVSVVRNSVHVIFSFRHCRECPRVASCIPSTGH